MSSNNDSNELLNEAITLFRASKMTMRDVDQLDIAINKARQPINEAEEIVSRALDNIPLIDKWNSNEAKIEKLRNDIRLANKINGIVERTPTRWWQFWK